MNEKIGAPRYQVRKMNIIYDTGDEFWTGPVVDVSETGLFIETVHELEPGTEVTILPELGGDEDAAEHLPFEIRARVVRINEYDLDVHWDRTPGIAFIWEGMSEEEQEQLRQFFVAHGVLVRR